MIVGWTKEYTQPKKKYMFSIKKYIHIDSWMDQGIHAAQKKYKRIPYLTLF